MTSAISREDAKARMSTQLDDVLEKLSLEDKLELVRRVRVNSLTLQEGDRVEASRRLRGSYPDDGLEAEEGRGAESADYCVPFHVPPGTLGRVTLVRQYVAPFPYRVLFDNAAQLSLAEGDVVRVAEQPSERERERDDALWRIPPDGMFTIYCARWIDRVGRPCPQLNRHPGPCGLPPR
ncbi:hypothetical protein J7E91_35370 [Streptomyces sp. ISL-99]|uniref:hypothetical protein n=1 Tax=Streptomyces sp. ISL-99 TaxID=2819193 RepID=UPI001BECE56C|nr:hypothetical protein [Streptomyces sp. ISL-99]MBT2530484.1 hypothetical protein [Streptomyces sp. ISL-99]